MTAQQSLEIINSIDAKIWFLLLKFGFAAFLVILVKNFVTHLYQYLFLRWSKGYGINTKVEYEGEIYYIDDQTFTNIVLIKGSKRVFIPISRFMTMPVKVIRNGNPDKK